MLISIGHLTRFATEPHPNQLHMAKELLQLMEFFYQLEALLELHFLTELVVLICG